MRHYWLAFTCCFAILLFASPATAEESALEVLSWHCDQEGHMIVIRGEVRNHSDTSIHVQLLAIFRSTEGTAVRNTFGLPAFYPLPPGETSPFEVSTPHRADIAECELMIKDMSKDTLDRSPGKQQLQHKQ